MLAGGFSGPNAAHGGNSPTCRRPTRCATFSTRNSPDKQPPSGRFAHVYPVKLTAKQSFLIDLESKQFDAFLRLEDAAGKELASDDDGGEGTNARILFTAPEIGEYRIIATSFDASARGFYDLYVHETKLKAYSR